jgi:TfoX/Sxy family transcriptional regulator of competence genes
LATDKEFAEFVCEQIAGIGNVRSRKMFGEYMVYVNDKPILLVCDNTIFVKMLPELSDILCENEIGTPYAGAKEHYILDVDNVSLLKEVISITEPIIPFPKPKKAKKSKI